MRISSTCSIRPRDRPLQVYLDSSDYSVLSHARTKRESDAGVLESLQKYVDRGDIEIRFSSVHLVEAAHLDAESRRFAIDRAHCIQELTRGKCFRFWSEMPALECVSLLTNRPLFDNVMSENGQWHPDLSDTAQSLRNLLIDEFKKLGRSTSLNRQQRKRFERQYFSKGVLSPAGIKLLAHGRTELLETLSRQFPLGERFYRDDLMLNFAAGKASASEVIEELSVVFRDVETFIGWTYDTRDKERKLVSWLRSYGDDMASRIQSMRLELERTIQNAKVLQTSKELLRQALEARIPRLRETRIKSIREDLDARRPKVACSESQWQQLEDSPIGTIPSLDSHIVAFYEHFRRNLQMSRKPKASDAGDIFHLTHLPYCHLFRADGDAAQTAKVIASAYGTTVVPKLAELPAQIEHALQQKERSTHMSQP